MPSAVLFDRDNTLVVDVPYNGDPELVEPMPGAAAALDLIRAHGIPVGVISNQSGVGRGLITREQVDAVNARVAELLGPFDVWEICPHVAADGCSCRKPEPGMLRSAARRLGLDPGQMVFVGDIGADMGAARAAGCRGILVPTAITLREEVAAAGTVAADLTGAVRLALGLADSDSAPEPARATTAAGGER
ncbi:D-glycero-alpha-D-manno-heptose-1,7-bisphosphate 7-phosphatase [Corynebacterium halotolerans]|uniref:D-glycero-alpha-D-manno-heptose-1,7-bisphosphate 7-phosphatase n=1 Tax=Corynebacterium halotolerans TaxID=225326 RepID=UPI001B7F8946|nr:HAD family hydrolase [Corynebacterium halotolerans]